jgi:hypothetical protein
LIASVNNGIGDNGRDIMAIMFGWARAKARGVRLGRRRTSPLPVVPRVA